MASENGEVIERELSFGSEDLYARRELVEEIAAEDGNWAARIALEAMNRIDARRSREVPPHDYDGA